MSDSTLAIGIASFPSAARSSSSGLDEKTPHVEFRNVCKSYDGTTQVVADLELNVEKGEFLTLLGPSGSGKTTSLMMLAGFETVSSGELFVRGKPVKDLPPYRRDIGVVFQSYALFPHMSVAENIAFPLSVRGVPKVQIKTKVERALEMVQLSGMGERKPARLSGGQQQRVALARALVFEPALVLLDEPLGALDRQLRESMQYELKRIHDALGVTMIYVTHDQAEALTMSDRIAVFNDGKVQQLGKPQELYGLPANVFVASFLGENNFLDVSVDAINAGTATVSGRDIKAATALTGARLSPGDRATLAIRPERLKLGSGAAPKENLIQATAIGATFLGDQMRLSLRTDSGQDLVVKQTLSSAFNPPEAGSNVTLGFERDGGIILEARR